MILLLDHANRETYIENNGYVLLFFFQFPCFLLALLRKILPNLLSHARDQIAHSDRNSTIYPLESRLDRTN